MGGGFEFARGMGGWVNGWMGGWVGEVWASERARGKEHRFMKLMKEKKGKITLPFTSPEKEKYFYMFTKSLLVKKNKKR